MSTCQRPTVSTKTPPPPQSRRRELLNMVDGHEDEKTRTPGINDGWMTVKSKKERRDERMKSRVSTVKNGSVSRVNEHGKTKRVSFAMNSNSLILI